MDHTRLSQLAESAGATPHRKKPPLALKCATAAASVDDAAGTEARQLLATRRQANPTYRDPTRQFSKHFKTKKKIEKQLDTTQWKYTQPELDAALQDAIDENKPISVIAALLQQKAQTNFKKALPRAISVWSDDLTCLLLNHRGTQNIEVVLETSLAAALEHIASKDSQDPDANQAGVVSALIAAGARVRVDSLDATISQEQTGILEILLRRKDPLPSAVLSDCLLIAVRLKSNYDILSMLLAYGADPNVHGAENVLNAINQRNYKLTVALLALSPDHRVSKANVTLCIRHLLSSVSSDQHLQWLELLLLAGGDSATDGLAKRLRQAVLADEKDIVELLVHHGTQIASSDSNALEAAISIFDKTNTRRLLESTTAPASIAGLIPTLHQWYNREDRIQVLQWMLAAGATGRGLDETLATHVADIIDTNGSQRPSDQDQRYLQVLLDGGADVDWDGGVSLKDAFAASNLVVARQLCRSGPSSETLSATMALVYESSRAKHLAPPIEIVENVLQRGPDETAINEALLRTVRHGSNNEGLIELLIKYKADVCYRDGDIVQLALSLCNNKIFKLIAQNISGPEIVEKMFRSSFSDISKANILLQTSHSQKMLDDGLAGELRSPAIRHNVVDFLLRNGASVDSDGGFGLQEVCRKQDLCALGMLVNRASESVRGRALCVTIESGGSQRVFIASELLDEGCPANTVNEALVLAVSKSKQRAAIATQQSTMQSTLGVEINCGSSDDRLVLLELLLRHGANINYGQGAALKAAVDDSAWRILEELVKHDPSAIMLDRVFSHARSTLKGDESRYNAYYILLSVAGAIFSELNSAVVDIAGERSQHKKLWKVLLSRDVSANYSDGEAIIATIKHRNFGFLPMLLEKRPLMAVLNKALLLAMKDTPKFRLIPVKMLLEAGASDSVLDGILNQAVKEQDPDLIGLLLEYHKSLGPGAADSVSLIAVSGNVEQLRCLLANVTDRSIVSKALDAVTNHHIVRKLPTGLECACLLLDKDVEQRCRDKALASYVDDIWGTNELDQAYVTALLDHSADVNAFSGQCLQNAARNGRAGLFQQLMSHSATSSTLTAALPFLFNSSMAEEEVTEIIHDCFACQNKPQVNESLALEHLTYLSLLHYPAGHGILQTLLKYGYSALWEKPVTIRRDVGEERANALVCALAQDREGKISPEVLRTLLEANGTYDPYVEVTTCAKNPIAVEVDFATHVSKITPLMIAASNNRLSAVQLLLEHNANVDLIDRSQRSAQSYAGENGYLEVVQKLHTRGAKVNDGSLHEAARELHYPVVRYLLQGGHEPDFRSTLHEGRSALAETLLKAQILTIDRRPDLEKTIQVLLDAKADPTIKYDNKNALYCALANERPCEVLGAYLATDQWKTLDAKYNWYTDASGKCYSATMYLERGPWQGKPFDRQKLMELLRMEGCEDRYFVWEGEQPEDMLGLPDELAETYRAQRAIIDSHRLQLRLNREAHNQQLEFGQERHVLTLEQDSERAARQLETDGQQHQQRVEQQSQLALQQEAIVNNQNSVAERHLQRQIELRTEERNSEVKLQRDLLRDQEQAQERQTTRQIGLIDRNDRSEKSRHQQRLLEVQAQTGLLTAGANYGGGYGAGYGANLPLQRLLTMRSSSSDGLD